jgi:hypothetical protein
MRPDPNASGMPEPHAPSVIAKRARTTPSAVGPNAFARRHSPCLRFQQRKSASPTSSMFLRKSLRFFRFSDQRIWVLLALEAVFGQLTGAIVGTVAAECNRQRTQVKPMIERSAVIQRGAEDVSSEPVRPSGDSMSAQSWLRVLLITIACFGTNMATRSATMPPWKAARNQFARRLRARRLAFGKTKLADGERSLLACQDEVSERWVRLRG